MVVPMPGGPASKAANRYEHLWTVLRVCELLEGTVGSIRLEPPGDAGVGIEMEVEIDGAIWAEQAKSSAKKWTIHELAKEGVLAAAKAQIDSGRNFRLVASSSASDLSTLVDRSRKTESYEEFTESLGQLRGSHLAQVAQAWEVSNEDARLLLLKVTVEQYSRDALTRIVSTTLRRLFVDDPDVVIGEMRNFCDEHLHLRLAAPQIWSHLESKGIRRSLIVGDSSIIGSLRGTVGRQRYRVERAAPSVGFVRRSDADEILGKLLDPNGAQLMVVDGRAGTGKSKVAFDVAAQLDSEGWHVALARMDGNATASTARELGHRMGLTESPSVLLAGVADGRPALLVVDQLDAVSTYSGRMSDNFTSVTEAISEAERMDNLKVMLVVRTADLDADPRMVSLLRREEQVERHTVGVLDVDDIKAHLARHDMPVPASATTLELLRTPLHFSVFTRLDDRSRAEQYRTLQDLYQEYTAQVRRNIEQQVGDLDWVSITAAIVTHMSRNEVLTAPAHLLDGANQSEVAALMSEGVLVKDNSGIAFFHESYFDYLFARSFVGDGGDLCDFLVQSGQYLFRRAQTRQVLEYLVGADRDRFRETVVALLADEQVRSHLKAVAIHVLSQIQPAPEDWQALEEVAWSDSPVRSKLIGLLHLTGWFDAADQLGRWERWLKDSERVDEVFSRLIFVARDRPMRVAELVRPYIGKSEQWRLRLRDLVAWSLNSGLVDLTDQLITKGQLDDIRGPIAVNSDFWTLLHSLSQDDPAGAARLVGAFLFRGLARARQVSAADPFESGHLSEDSSSQSESVIVDVASGAPAAFIDNVLPFVICLVVQTQNQPSPGRLPRSRRWAWQHRSTVHTVPDAVFAGTERALRALATDNPEACSTVLRDLRNAENYQLRFLACRALTATDNSNNAIGWLLSDTRNLALGWADSPSWASRELIERHSVDCSPEVFDKLQTALLAYTPPWDERPFRGRDRYELMSALDSTRLSTFATHKLHELERRFPKSPPTPPRPIEAHWVASPIEEDSSKLMSDEHWTRALKKHTGTETRLTPDGKSVGGTTQLAQQLGTRAKEDPERFARLALQFTADIPVEAMNQTLQNTEGALGTDLLADLCEHAHRTYASAVGRWVCRAIARVDGVDSRLVQLISVYAQDTDPTLESTMTYGPGWDVMTAGLNSTRGQAALTAARVLFGGNDHIDALIPTVSALALDELLAVRVCAAEAVLALLNHTPETALNLAEGLFDTAIEVLNAPTSQRLLTYAVLRDPDRFISVVAEALAGPPEIAEAGGQIWAVAHQQGRLTGSVPTDVRELPTMARHGAAEVFARQVVDSLEILALLLNDDDDQVRKTAVRALFRIDEMSTTSDQEALLNAYLGSEAFPAHLDHVIHRLKEITTTLPSNTIDICEQAIGSAGANLGDVTTVHYGMGRDLIAIVLRLYRQGGKTLRVRCLDLIDRLTELNAYDTAALDNER